MEAPISECIDSQISCNRGRNLYYKFIYDVMGFSAATFECVMGLNEGQRCYALNYTIDKVLQEICRINQYYDFDSASKNVLKTIYERLIDNIKSGYDISSVLHRHRNNLVSWLKYTNQFSVDIYSPDDEFISPVPCSEYSPELQLRIMCLNLSRLSEPVLDVGCGRKGELVNYLKVNGIAAFGIDRFKTCDPCVQNVNWLEFDYGINKWGAVISNLGFSNHFIHHHLRGSGKYIEYAKTYMKILHSLKIGGKFHYSPSLRFIEQYLDSNQFDVKNYDVENSGFQATTITKLTEN